MDEGGRRRGLLISTQGSGEESGRGAWAAGVGSGRHGDGHGVLQVRDDAFLDNPLDFFSYLQVSPFSVSFTSF